MTVGGYEIGRDQGTTAKERQVFDLITRPRTFEEIGAIAGVSKQRVGQIVKSLVAKGLLVRQGQSYVMARVEYNQPQAAAGDNEGRGDA